MAENPQATLTREQVLRMLEGGTVQLPTPVGMLDVKCVPQPRWTKLRRVHMDDTRKQRWQPSVPDEVWANDLYEVLVYQRDDVKHLSIKRFDRAPIRNWRHFQQIKNEVGGPETEAVELFPAESRLMDNANQYHLFVMPEGMRVPIGFEHGAVLIRDEEVAVYNHAPHNGRQEPLQRGLTTGRALDNARAQDPELDSAMRQALGLFG